MGEFKTLKDFDFSGKKVLVRVDLNVPVAAGKVTDPTRIVRSAPTVLHILRHGGTPILLSHFGRPSGRMAPDMSLGVVVDAASAAFDKPVKLLETDWSDVRTICAELDRRGGDTVFILENTRFHPGEEKNDPELAARMASLGDIYINDAFSTAHRAHASTEALARCLPSGAGYAMAAELDALERGLGNPEKPVIAIVGGAKVSTKIDLLENLVTRVNALVIGGGMANTFLHAQGVNIGKSLCEQDMTGTVQRIFARADKANSAIILPVDGVVTDKFQAHAPNRTCPVDAVDPGEMILDVGSGSVQRIKDVIDTARTLIWNGPLGAFELDPFGDGTIEIAQHAARRTKKGNLISVAGGGDTTAALARAGVVDAFTYVSTAGGAFLEWMEGKQLPGVEAIRN